VVSDPGLVLTPVVLGPRRGPVVTDVDVARRHPQLTGLSALAHGGRADPTPVFGAPLAALGVMDHDHAGLHTDLGFTALPAAARVWLEEFMTTAAYRHESEFARRLGSRFKAEGKAEGEASALVAILDARRIQVPDDVRAELMACTDTAQLEAWIRRAATADKIQDVLD